jgi:hypothetical protein
VRQVNNGGGGRLILQPDYQVETFRALQIDSSTTTLIKAGLNKNCWPAAFSSEMGPAI